MANERSASAVNTTEPAKLLAGLELFSDLEPAELEMLSAGFESVRVASHTRLYSSGEAVDHFFIISRGEVSIFREELGRPLQLQARLGPGEYFGEMGLFGGDQRSSARSSVTTDLLRIPKERFLDFLDRRPALAVKIQVAAARRHSENVAAALDLGQRQDVRIRLGRRVLIETPFRQHSAMIENLSLGGLCLREVPAAWQPGVEVSFRLAYQESSLDVEARVSWREEHTAGLAFVRNDPEHEEAVQRMLRRLLE
ncbi:MAG: cyclic nucleotide-binding domain-containing protein [Acidobacteriota bacterium]